MTSRNYSEVAIQYAEDVLSGEIPVGPYVKLACKRFLNDLDRQGTDEFPYIYDPDAAHRACRFMELMPHTKGKWASKQELLVLEPWQVFIECNIFGWLHEEKGTRRFREAYEEVPRKNGKSMRLAARGVYLFVADSEAGSEVYSGATTEKQAYEIFRPAWQMVSKLPQMKDRFDIQLGGTPKNPGAMFVMSDMSRFETLIGKPGDGASPHGALIDEYHEHDSDNMVDTMQTGMGAREQPLLSIITTAGTMIGGPCYLKRKEVIGILEGKEVDERTFAIIYSLDEDDDWSDPANLIKANPNYGVSVFPDFLESQLQQARRSATKQNAFRTKHLNEWVGASTAWMNMVSWQKQRRDLEYEDLSAFPCWAAVDLASKKDVAALVFLFKDEDKYFCKSEFFVPEKALQENQKYQALVADGHLTTTPGSQTDYAFIEERLKEVASMVDLQDVAFDDWQANYLMTRLQNTSIPVVNYNQTVRNMSDPMKEVEAKVLDEKLFHDGNSAMTWMMGNVVAKFDAKDNIYPRKDNDDFKIDGPVALIMAMGRAIASAAETKPTYGIVII